MQLVLRMKGKIIFMKLIWRAHRLLSLSQASLSRSAQLGKSFVFESQHDAGAGKVARLAMKNCGQDVAGRWGTSAWGFNDHRPQLIA